MQSRATAPELKALSEERIRRQLARIVGSTTFQPVDRLRRFLTFIVNEAAAGRADQMKEYLVGVKVFDKQTSFDPRNDPIVRVQARRLRSRLSRYYRDEGQNDEILIEVPKGGYTPIFRAHDAAAAPRRSVTNALTARNTVAVLPFANDTQDADFEYFCRGIVQEITHGLAKIHSLRVIAWGPAYDSSADDPRERGTTSDAAMVVSGSARKAADQIRVTVQLVDGASGTYLWSDRIDGSIEDIFGLQEQVASSVVAQLEAEIVGAPGTRSARRPPENLAARNLYLQGRYQLEQRTEEGFRKAAELFEKAIAEDGQYALAHAGLADAYGLLAHYGYVAPAEVWTKAASSAAAAVLVDELCVEAHTSLAHVRSTQDWDWRGSEKEFRQAISLNPRHPTARHWYAVSCLAPLGRLDEALEQILIAQSLDPVSSIIARDVAVVHYYQRDFETALDRCDHAIELNPHFSPAYLTLGLIQEQREDFDEAAAALERANYFSPKNPRIQGSLARVLAKSGKRKQALRIVNELQELSRTRYVSPFDMAYIHLELGQGDCGLEWLRKAFEDRCFELISLNVDPRFDSWKSEERFTSLSARLHLDGP